MRELLGIVKDKVSLSKLALLKNPNTSPLHIAVLRTTTHSPATPPNPHHLATLLSLGDSSRATASILTHSLITRLHRTTDAYVALKSLFTIHHIIKHGPFILKDQLSVLTSTAGRNHFKLSNFHHPASATTWLLSTWVRWYACYIETILHTSKNVGFVVICSFLENQKQQDSISSLTNFDLIKDFGSLVGVIEQICKVPGNLLVENDQMIQCVVEVVGNDYMSIVNEIVLRVIELKERVSLNLLSFDDSVELSTELERLTSCNEKLLQLFSTRIRKPAVETVWEMIEELNDRIGMVKFGRLGRRDGWSESERFGDRVVSVGDSLKFSSGRLRLK